MSHFGYQNYQQGDKLLLKDIKKLEFYRSRLTKGRRLEPQPQLECKSSKLDCSNVNLDYVACENLQIEPNLSSNSPTFWKCRGNLPEDYQFKTTLVNCEGYDSPSDIYVLKGSCKLDYTLTHCPGGCPSNDVGSQNPLWTWLFFTFFFGVLGTIVVKIFTGRNSPSNYTNQTYSNDFNNNRYRNDGQNRLRRPYNSDPDNRDPMGREYDGYGSVTRDTIADTQVS